MSGAVFWHPIAVEPKEQLDSGRSMPATVTVFVPKGSISFINVPCETTTGFKTNNGQGGLGSQPGALSAGKQPHWLAEWVPGHGVRSLDPIRDIPGLAGRRTVCGWWNH